MKEGYVEGDTSPANYRVWGSVVSSPSGVRGRAPGRKRVLVHLQPVYFLKEFSLNDITLSFGTLPAPPFISSSFLLTSPFLPPYPLASLLSVSRREAAP